MNRSRIVRFSEFLHVAGNYGGLFVRYCHERLALARARRQLAGLDDRMLKDMGLVRADLGGLLWHRGSRQDVVSAKLYEVPSDARRSGSLFPGIVATLAVVALLAMSLLTAKTRPADQIAIASCPLFHPGMMGSASRSASPHSLWTKCSTEIR
jgi:hypothetical protein